MINDLLELEIVELLLKLTLTFIFSGVIGYNRGINSQGAGLRTHILVGMGAALSMIISLEGLAELGFSNSDPYRLSAQVISGIGFLGAGTIIKSGESIKGLTTAASLWTVAILGIGIGSGFYLISLVSFIFIYFVLDFVGKLNKRLFHKQSRRTIIISYYYNRENRKELKQYFYDNSLEIINNVIIKQERIGKEVEAVARIDLKTRNKDKALELLMRDLMQLSFIKNLDYLNETEKVYY